MRKPLIAALSLLVLAGGSRAQDAAPGGPLHLIVMDPLALQLSCTCVDGVGQRRYDQLAEHLASRLGRPVEVTFDESLQLALDRTGGKADLVIGKQAMVNFDTQTTGHAMTEIAALSDRQGRTVLRGVFLVRKDDPAQSLADLKGRPVALGPEEEAETHAAAKAALKTAAILDESKIQTSGSIDSAALALTDGETDAAVVSDFLPPLLEGCGKIDKGSVRVLAETKPVPFIRVFAASSLPPATVTEIRDALLAVKDDAALLEALESRDGFTAAPPRTEAEPVGWTDWRGPKRDGRVSHLPTSLPDSLTALWKAPLTGPAMAGMAATEKFIVIPDKDADFTIDIFRCLSAQDGSEVWTLEYPAAGDLDYSNAPRATPVIVGDLVYLQGAFGQLHCVELATGRIVWKKHLFDDFNAERLIWGASVPPLVLGEKLIVAPGGKDASLAALDRHTGGVIWKTPGHAAAYSAFIVATFCGVTQIIGYDSASVGGWDPETGARLWEVIPPDGSDFNVGTPVVIGDHLLLATENNATRLYAFDPGGLIVPEPVSRNDDLAPDTCTPVVAGDRVFATAYGDLYCLDHSDGLATVWNVNDDKFYDHANLIASDDRVLIWTNTGDLILLDASADAYAPLAATRPFETEFPDSLSHPAIVGERIYLRSNDELGCFELTTR